MTLKLNAVKARLGSTNFAFDLTCETGSATALIGPSGSGKTTLLNVVAGFVPTISGTISIDDIDMTSRAPDERPVSMIFQDHNLFPHLTAGRNVALGLAANGSGKSDDPRVLEALSAVGLAGREQSLAGEMSGGERQRVALARCLLRDHPVLLLDEPFAALGPAMRRDMLSLIESLRAERDLTILLVTHTPSDARDLADAVCYLEAGRTVATGPTSDMLNDQRLRSYLGAVEENARLL
ncbi:MAG: ATP-binding cassette domain-containing protein [Pseudomonadota bacterium]